MKSTTLRLAALALAACLGGCSSEPDGDGKPPVIDTSNAPPARISETNPSGIPSSGRSVTKRKPDPVGAMSPIIPKR